MKSLLKKFLIILFAVVVVCPPSFSKDYMKMITTINHDFTIDDISDEVSIMTSRELKLPDGEIVPEDAVLTIKTLQAQKERRWHKSAFILGKLDSYTILEIDEENLYDNYLEELYEDDFENESETNYYKRENLPIKKRTKYDISDKNLYVKIYKYEPINKKEAAILTTEIVVTMAASYFAPGVDIGYFFLKGAILREKHPNWFIAGVHNAYDNSICWFWLKGKPIELEVDSQIKMHNIKEKKALELKSQIEQRKDKQEIKDTKKQVKKDKSELKKSLKFKDFESNNLSE